MHLLRFETTQISVYIVSYSNLKSKKRVKKQLFQKVMCPEGQARTQRFLS